MNDIKALIIKSGTRLASLPELYDRQAKWPMSDDAANDENKARPRDGGGARRESNGDAEQRQPWRRTPTYTDRTSMC